MAASTNFVFAFCFLVLGVGLGRASTIPPTPQAVQQLLQDPQDAVQQAEVQEALANNAAKGGFGVVGVPAEPTDNGVLTTQAAPTTAAPTTSAPTTVEAATSAPTTASPTTSAPTASEAATSAPTTSAPTTLAPTTIAAATSAPTTTAAPTTQAAPVTAAPVVVAADTNASIAADTTTSSAAPTPGAPVNPTAVPFPLPPYDCYDCNSGSALPGFWRNKNCDASGYVAQWYVPTACNTYCFSSVGLYPAGAVFRGCASSLYLKGRPMQQGCFDDPDNDRFVCLCAGNNCNTHDLSELAETYADQYIAMQSTTAQANVS